MKPYISTFILACALMAGFSATAQTPVVRITTSGAEDTTIIYTYVEQMPEYAGPGTLIQYIREHSVYPQSALEKGEEGTVYVKLTISKTGKVSDAVVSISSDYPDLDAAALAMAKAIPDFTPGRQNGKTVAVYYTVPVAYYTITKDDITDDVTSPGMDDYMSEDSTPMDLMDVPSDYDVMSEDSMAMEMMDVPSDYDAVAETTMSADADYTTRSYIEKKNIKDLKIEEKPEKKAAYVFGTTEMFKTVNRDVQYPYAYYGNKPKGYVVLKFVVGADSVIYNAEVIKSLGPEYDQNALNLINNMRADWLPATKKGKPVSSYFYLPVRFEYRKNSWEY